MSDTAGPGRPRGSLPEIPVRMLIPNAITMMALAAGATGVRFAISGEFAKAAAAIVIAAILDGLDGRIARLLRGTSRFGAELDSLSDVTAFGIAPALILYLWALDDLGRLGWPVALILAVCCALRLARFNAALDDEAGPRKRLGFLTGVPAPAGAGLALAPLFFSLAVDDWLDSMPVLRAGIAAAFTLAAALLMVSTLPTWSAAAVRIARTARLPALVGVGLFAAFLAQAPWATLATLSALYALSIPFAVVRFRALRAAEGESAEADAVKPDQPAG